MTVPEPIATAPAMTTVGIRHCADATRFRPSRLRLADGLRLDVPHPGSVAIFHKAPRIAVEHDDGTNHQVHLPIVTSVEILPTPRPARRKRAPRKS